MREKKGDAALNGAMAEPNTEAAAPTTGAAAPTAEAPSTAAPSGTSAIGLAAPTAEAPASTAPSSASAIGAAAPTDEAPSTVAPSGTSAIGAAAPTDEAPSTVAPSGTSAIGAAAPTDEASPTAAPSSASAIGVATPPAVSAPTAAPSGTSAIGAAAPTDEASPTAAPTIGVAASPAVSAPTAAPSGASAIGAAAPTDEASPTAAPTIGAAAPTAEAPSTAAPVSPSPDRSFLAHPSDSSAPLRAAIFCFSDRGAALAERIAGLFPGARTVRPRGDLAARTAECFRECDALIFVGAAGIAVRAIAPHVAAKTADPAVIVADDCGRHVVSLLSGHIGGANRLTRQIAARIGAEPVVTTATDVNQRFSIDEWAARRGLSIESMDAAKRFSAEILRRDLPLTGDFPVDGPLPAGVFPGAEGDVGAAISCYRKHPFAVTALLSPRIVHLGIGCKRGAGAEAIAAAVDGLNLAPGAIVRAASIDVKAHEPGLLAFCRARGIEIRFYSAAELSAAEGEFTPSEFVKKTVGVDNVCERAAAVSAGPGAKIFIRKTRGDGVTVAAAMQDWRISFE